MALSTATLRFLPRSLAIELVESSLVIGRTMQGPELFLQDNIGQGGVAFGLNKTSQRSSLFITLKTTPW